MVITNRELRAGTKLVGRYRGQEHTVLVLGDEATGKGYELDNGTIFKSLSAAGSAVMNGTACNGWRFWTVVGEEPVTGDGEPVRATRPATEAKPAKTAKPRRTATTKQVRKVPNQKGVPEGQARWFCSACMAGFFHDLGSEPGTCPEGHPREIADEFAGMPSTDD